MYAVFVGVNNGLFALFVETLTVLYTSDVSPCPCPGPRTRVLEYVLEFTMFFNSWDTCVQLGAVHILYNAKIVFLDHPHPI